MYFDDPTIKENPGTRMLSNSKNEHSEFLDNKHILREMDLDEDHKDNMGEKSSHSQEPKVFMPFGCTLR